MLYHDGFQDFLGLDETVKKTARKVKALHKKGEIDCMIVTGMSGVIVAVPVMMKTGVPLVIVRKKGEKPHTDYKFIGMEEVKDAVNFLFVDDLIDMGETRHKVTKMLKKEKPQAHIVGTYLYAEHKYTKEEGY